MSRSHPTMAGHLAWWCMLKVHGPFGSSKFLIRRDPTPAPAPASSSSSPSYYALSTNITLATAALGRYNARNNLVLSISLDLVTWRVCSTVASDDTGLTPLDSIAYTGFEYVCSYEWYAPQRSAYCTTNLLEVECTGRAQVGLDGCRVISRRAKGSPCYICQLVKAALRQQAPI